MEKYLKECKLCPHNCKVNRLEGVLGRCRAGKNVKVALCDLHFFEEPCISGTNGSGTVFFSGCNLNCKYCQNYKISQLGMGKEIEIEELAEEFLRLQERNANNINLVTGFMFIPQLVEAIKLAREKGLKIPIIYNSSGFESVDALKLLDGYIDVYLPDMKYYYDDLGKKFSNISNYFDISKAAIKEMYRQVGSPKFDENGMIKKGLIIRHLVLPNHLQNSKEILKWIKYNIDEEVFVSIMAQYFPSYKANNEEDINRKLSLEEYEEIERFVYKLDIKNGYLQDLESDEQKYVPDFESANK